MKPWLVNFLAGTAALVAVIAVWFVGLLVLPSSVANSREDGPGWTFLLYFVAALFLILWLWVKRKLAAWMRARRG